MSAGEYHPPDEYCALCGRYKAPLGYVGTHAVCTCHNINGTIWHVPYDPTPKDAGVIVHYKRKQYVVKTGMTARQAEFFIQGFIQGIYRQGYVMLQIGTRVEYVPAGQVRCEVVKA